MFPLGFETPVGSVGLDDWMEVMASATVRAEAAGMVHETAKAIVRAATSALERFAFMGKA